MTCPNCIILTEIKVKLKNNAINIPKSFAILPKRMKCSETLNPEDYTTKVITTYCATNTIKNVLSGFLGETTHTSTTTPADPLENFYKSRAVRTKPPTGSTAQPIYDFDEWSRQHYGQTARKIQEMKRRKAFYAEEHRRNEEALWQGKIAGFVMFVMIFFFVIHHMLFHPNDQPKPIPSSKN